MFSRLRTSINRWYQASWSTRCCRGFRVQTRTEKIYEKGIYDSRISPPDRPVAPTTSGAKRSLHKSSGFTSFSSTTRRTVWRCSPSIFRLRFRFQCRVLRLVRTFKAAQDRWTFSILRGRSKNSTRTLGRRVVYSSTVNEWSPCGANYYWFSYIYQCTPKHARLSLRNSIGAGWHDLFHLTRFAYVRHFSIIIVHYSRRFQYPWVWLIRAIKLDKLGVDCFDSRTKYFLWRIGQRFDRNIIRVKYE